MRLVAALLLALLVPVAAHAGPATRGYTDAEALEKLVDESALLVLARVLAVDETVRAESVAFDPAFTSEMIAAMKASGPRLRRARIEPIAWLKGGLDADALEVWTVEGTGLQLPEPAGWRALAGVDTLAALVSLTRRGEDWVLRGDPAAGLPGGFRAVRQSGFGELADSCAAARDRLVPDSLLARADLVAIIGPSADPDAPAGPLAVEKVLAGAAPAGEIVIRSARPRLRPARRLMALRRVEEGVYELVPFHRVAWTAPAGPGNIPDATPESVEPEVRAALERLAKVGRGPVSPGGK